MGWGCAMTDGAGPPDRGDRFPVDLAVIAVVGVVTAVLAAVASPALAPVRAAFGFAFVLVAPGYVTVAAVFPEASRARSRSADSPSVRAHGISPAGRAALALGLSCGLVPLLLLVLNLSSLPFDRLSIGATVGGYTAAATLVAVVRRQRLPPSVRFCLPLAAWRRTVRETASRSSADGAAVAVLALSLLAAGSVAGLALADAESPETYTEFYTLADGPNGTSQSATYPTTVAAGEPLETTVGLTNREHERVQYTVVVRLQRMRVQGNRTSVASASTLDRFRATLSHGETVERQLSVRPEATGTSLRLQFLLFRGEAPPDPAADGAYRELHRWVRVR